MQARAIVFVANSEVALQSIEMPPPGPGEVQVRTHSSSISVGTESWILRDLFMWFPIPFPCVPGYQRVGTIVALGEGVTGWKLGDRVMATEGRWPGEVVPCLVGAHIELANTPVEELYAVPEQVDDTDAAGAVVLQVGYNAASRVVMDAGDWVVVYGDGLIGQVTAQAARARGAKVILVGHRKERLALAAAHSADDVINSGQEDVAASVRRCTGGAPVVAVLDTIQSEATQREYVPLLERGVGQVVYCGHTPGSVWADMGLYQRTELTTHYVSGWTRPRMDATLRLVAEGRMSLRPLITHHVPAAEGPAMYRMVLAKSEPFLGITLDWQADR